MRVNIESSALAEGRFNKLAQDYFEGSRIEAIGSLVLFWFDSQEREFISGPKIQVKEFLPYFNESENESFFNALLKYGYIKEIGPDLFEISGNNKHVEKLQHLRTCRSDAAKKMHQIHDKTKKRMQKSANDLQKPANDILNALQFNALQFNAVQCNAIQCNTNVVSATAGDVAPVIAEFPTISQKLFDSWLETYQDKTWINLEIKKAQAWIHANPRKAPKTDFARFLNNWLSRGWENYRKTIKPDKKNTWLETYEAKIQGGEVSNGS